MENSDERPRRLTRRFDCWNRNPFRVRGAIAGQRRLTFEASPTH